MQRDRRHQTRRMDRHIERDEPSHRTSALTRRGPGRTLREGGGRRGQGAWRVPPRATAQPDCALTRALPEEAARRRKSMRGAVLLDVMFTLAALMAGAQGFAHWQAASGMSSAALSASPTMVTMAMPSQIERDAVHVRPLR